MISTRSLLSFAALALIGHVALAADKNPVVVIETSAGTIKVELLADKAPVTVKNFLDYVDDKFYDGTIFHRVIPNFMIQGGGLEPGMREKPTKAPINNEASNGVANDRGTVAMARVGGQPNSATSQFFINLKGNAFLNKAQAQDGAGYCVFGKVVDGMDVVDKIAQAQTVNRDRHQNVPAEDIVIKSIRKE
jgi:cyclophilin family peptidyl-prolyl cis-trans isomerase